MKICQLTSHPADPEMSQQQHLPRPSGHNLLPAETHIDPLHIAEKLSALAKLIKVKVVSKAQNLALILQVTLAPMLHPSAVILAFTMQTAESNDNFAALCDLRKCMEQENMRELEAAPSHLLIYLPQHWPGS